MNDFLSLAQKRYAVRSYLPKPVEAEKLERILEAGAQPPRQKTTSRTSFSSYSKPKGWRSSPNAPTCKATLWRSSSAASLPKRGYAPTTARAWSTPTPQSWRRICFWRLPIWVWGSCWMTRFDPSVIRELFRIPEGIEPEHILSIGYAAENAHPSERHTSRKPLADLVVEESF